MLQLYNMFIARGDCRGPIDQSIATVETRHAVLRSRKVKTVLGQILWRDVGLLSALNLLLLRFGPCFKRVETRGIIGVFRIFGIVPGRLLLSRKGRMKIIDVRPDFTEKKRTTFAQRRDFRSMKFSKEIRRIFGIFVDLFQI